MRRISEQKLAILEKTGDSDTQELCREIRACWAGTPDFNEWEGIAVGMDASTYALWVDIGRRLLHGQKHYGGFKFAGYDLDQMALEELEDYIVYRAAKKYLKEKTSVEGNQT